MSLPPIETFCGSIALIRHPDEGERLWLTRRDGKDSQLDFVRAERLDNESYRECLDREIAWELNLKRGRDYIVSSAARIHLQMTLGDPDGDAQELVIAEFYVVDFYGRAGLGIVENDPDNHWLTRDELLAGAAECGISVKPGLRELLTKADVLSPG